ncbi:MAG: glycerol kinase GlpK [Alphaproteobacteria bacterium]
MPVLAIDQGTTSTRAIVFDDFRRPLSVSQVELTQHYPQPGWVEHDPEEIWSTVVTTAKEAIARARLDPAAIAGIGITNQRETVVLWDRTTGKPIANAIVWQDRRTAADCERYRTGGLEPDVSERTGLLLDPYFSATKIGWLLDNVPGARGAAEAGRILFGTIDSFLIWRLTGGKTHATDATNAARTLLYNIERNRWDDELLRMFSIPAAVLPKVLDCAADFGVTEQALFGAPIKIRGVAGDQQAATIGQACFKPGMMKSTYGTGCFMLLNTGADRVRSGNRLLSTIAYRLNGETTYALEGAIFVAGAAVQWLRDGLKIIADAAESGALAETADPDQRIHLVPAFVGLGAPWWDPNARGALFGLTRSTGPAEIARAALESVAYQSADLLEAMEHDWPSGRATTLRVDGGMASSDWTMQCLADITGATVDRPTFLETTALGAAWLAGSEAGIWPDMAGFADSWELDRTFEPRIEDTERQEKLAGWRASVRRTLTTMADGA